MWVYVRVCVRVCVIYIGRDMSLCVCLFVCYDCQPENKNIFWIDSYDRSVSEMGCLLVDCFKLLVALELYQTLGTLHIPVLSCSTDHNFDCQPMKASFCPHKLRPLNRLVTMGDCSLVQTYRTDRLQKTQPLCYTQERDLVIPITFVDISRWFVICNIDICLHKCVATPKGWIKQAQCWLVSRGFISGENPLINRNDTI